MTTNLVDYLSLDRIIQIEATSRDAALMELARAIARSDPDLDFGTVRDAVLSRESLTSTRVGTDVAFPHSRIRMKKPCVIAVGRSEVGVDYEDLANQPVRLIVMVLVREEEKELYLQVLNQLGRLLRDAKTRERIIQAASARDVLEIFTAEPPPSEEVPSRRSRLSELTLKAAGTMATTINARAVLVCVDGEKDWEAVKDLLEGNRIIVAGTGVRSSAPGQLDGESFIHIPGGGRSREGQIKLAALFALGRGFITMGDRIVCVSGLSVSGEYDSLMVLRMESEYGPMFYRPGRELVPGLSAEVLERTIELATELAVEGREGKSLGTLFVLGDSENVQKYSKQLVINPFRGYPEEERNILDPSLEETIKEFSTLDGAFVVRGDGVIMAAGTYLRPVGESADLPSGLGARHNAAANITNCTNAIAVTVSESTGAVTLFRRGKILTVIEKVRR